jgi:transcriptional regulator of heat shock response
MTERQQTLLKLLVDSYIQTAEPVSSQSLVQMSRLGFSSATIRNDLAALEENGYVKSPHTSSGRVPTDKGYRFYIEWFVDKPRPSVRERRHLEERTRGTNVELRVRRLAQALSELTGNVVVLSSAPERSFATGIALLLEMPEFHDPRMVMHLGQMLDRRELWLKVLRRQLGDEIAILLGEESPFGKDMATMTLILRLANGERLLMSIIGPMRMNYEHNLAMLREAQQLMEEM